MLNFNFMEKIINQEIPEFVIGRIAYKKKIHTKESVEPLIVHGVIKTLRFESGFQMFK